MLVTGNNYEKLEAFRTAHPGVVVPGTGFFSHKTAEELQQIIDQTLTTLKKKRIITGGTGALRTAAGQVLKWAGSSDNGHTVRVRWGIHQNTAGTARGGGATTFRHFTVEDPGGGNDWHLYVDAQQQTIIEMSQAAGVSVQITNV